MVIYTLNVLYLHQQVSVDEAIHPVSLQRVLAAIKRRCIKTTGHSEATATGEGIQETAVGAAMSAEMPNSSIFIFTDRQRGLGRVAEDTNKL